MPRDEECQGWTLSTLYTHFDTLIKSNDNRYNQRFVDSKDAVQSALAAADKATGKAEEAQEKRNEGMNEFRGQLKDQSAGFVTRTELYLALAAICGAFAAASQYFRSH